MIMSVLLRVEQLLSSFKRFIKEYLTMTPRVLDHTMIQINDRNNFDHSKREVLKFIKFYKNITQSSYKIGIYQCHMIENTRISL